MFCGEEAARLKKAMLFPPSSAAGHTAAKAAGHASSTAEASARAAGTAAEIRHIAAVKAAGDKYEPYLLARAVMAVCTAMNKFYYEIRIMAEDERERTARLALTDAARQTIQIGLNLLGIQAPERM